MQVVFQNFIKKSNSLGYLKSKGNAAARKYSNEAALSLRSRRSGTKFAAPLLAELLIKYQRLPRVCLDIVSIRRYFLGGGVGMYLFRSTFV